VKITSSNEQCLDLNKFSFQPYIVWVDGSNNHFWYLDSSNSTKTTSTPYSTSANPTNIVYTASGTKQIYYIFTDLNGCSDTQNIQVKVFDNPTAVINSSNGVNQCFNQQSFSFNASNSTTASGSGPISSYNWTTSSSATISPNSTSNTVSVNYPNAGTYSLKLTITDSKGCKDDSTISITLKESPNSDFALSQNDTQCLSGNTFTFTATSVSNAGLNSSGYKWIIDSLNNDTLTGTGAGPYNYSYSNAGDYIVGLVSTSSNGCKDTVWKKIVILSNPSITASVTSSASQCLNGNNFSFSSNATNTNSYYWDFSWNNGTNTSTIANPSNISFSSSGVKSIGVIATSNNGCKDTALLNVTVTNSPNASFTIDSSLNCVTNNEIDVLATSSNGTGVSGSLTHQWNFYSSTTGANKSSSSKTRDTVSYSTTGSKRVKITTTDANGCTDTAIGFVRILGQPTLNSVSSNLSSQCIDSLGLKQNNFIFSSSVNWVSGGGSHYWVLDSVTSGSS